MGSRKGRLVATRKVCAARSPTKGDVFSSALLDLQTFQVDYLEKNLRVKPRKGKLGSLLMIGAG